MISLWTKLAISTVALTAGVALAACTVTSTTTSTGDGGTATADSGSSATDSGTKTDSGSTKTDAGGSNTCTALDLTQVSFGSAAACDTCVHTKCTAEINACFADTSAAGCACQALDDCINACPNDATLQTCIKACLTANPDGSTGEKAWLNCVDTQCGPADAGGNGSCQ